MSEPICFQKHFTAQATHTHDGELFSNRLHHFHTQETIATTKMIFSNEDTLSDAILSLESKRFSQAQVTITELSEDSQSDSE
jgi:hypothetical protein